jgi:uncharacterized protein
MKINLRDFKNSPHLVLEEDLNPEDLDMDIGVMHYSNELNLKVEAWKEEDDLTVQVHVEGEREFTCSLCLEEFNNVFEKDISLHYDIKGLNSVTIDQDVRDELIADHPIRILCKADCRGLCPLCGVNLNQGQCDCKGSE